jgi:hypothetical protein
MESFSRYVARPVAYIAYIGAVFLLMKSVFWEAPLQEAEEFRIPIIGAVTAAVAWVFMYGLLVGRKASNRSGLLLYTMMPAVMSIFFLWWDHPAIQLERALALEAKYRTALDLSHVDPNDAFEVQWERITVAKYQGARARQLELIQCPPPAFSLLTGLIAIVGWLGVVFWLVLPEETIDNL